MFLATKKDSNIDSVVIIDGEDCTFEYLSSLILVDKTRAVQNELGKVVSQCFYSVDGKRLNTGDSATVSNGKLVNAEVYKLCRFFDTKGSYTLIKQQAIGVIGCEVNGGGYPSKLILPCGDEISMGEWIRIDKSGNSSKCDIADYNLHQQAAE